MKIFSAVTFETDLAILKLSRPATLNKFVNVLCLAEKEFLSGSSCYAAGWGQTLDRRGEVNGFNKVNKMMNFM